jgi:O-antigen ligase
MAVSTTIKSATKARLTLPSILLYERADAATGWLLAAMLIFSPWAFGTTQQWSIWTMNLAGYALGTLLGIKLWVRHRLGHQPARWNTASKKTAPVWLNRVLVFATGLLLVYAAISALNARADYDPTRLTFTYRTHLSWLPHSYHRSATWRELFKYVAWASAFWALRDWLLGMTPEESRKHREGAQQAMVPARLKLLLWVLAVNGAVLGLEGIIQRLEGSGKLLFLVKPRVNPGALAQFGPYAYRSNAAQYLNLVWPVTLGFWWWLRRDKKDGKRASWLLLCAGVMAACPIISSSRAGALTSMVLLAAAVAVLISGKGSDGLAKLGVLSVFGIAVALGTCLGWDNLSPRLDELGEGYELREALFANAWVIAKEHAVFGTGPGTFEHVFQIYRESPNDYWPAQLHNDWLEILMTFGWLGFGLIGLALAALLLHSFCGVATTAGRRFRWLVWLALAGCLLQARWYFPFRIYSVVFLFLMLCAVVSTTARSEGAD